MDGVEVLPVEREISLATSSFGINRLFAKGTLAGIALHTGEEVAIVLAAIGLSLKNACQSGLHLENIILAERVQEVDFRKSLDTRLTRTPVSTLDVSALSNGSEV